MRKANKYNYLITQLPNNVILGSWDLGLGA